MTDLTLETADAFVLDAWIGAISSERPPKQGGIVNTLERSAICTEYDLAPIENPEYGQHTDDAYRINRTPISIDNRVPMASKDHVPRESDLYIFGLSCESGIRMHLWASNLKMDTRYRGVDVVVQVDNASVSDALTYLARRAREVDMEIGGIRLLPEDAPDARARAAKRRGDPDRRTDA